MIVDLDAEFLFFGAKLEEVLAAETTKIAATFSTRSPKLWAARHAILAVIASIHARDDKEVPTSEAPSKIWRASIHAAIVQGIQIVEKAISTGSYVQASALVRQEMEAVEALFGIRLGHQKPKVTPKINALKYLGADYGKLSFLTHLSNPDLMRDITDILATGIDPKLNVPFEKYLFGLHLTFLSFIALDMRELRPPHSDDEVNRQETMWLQSVCGILDEEGFAPPNQS